MAKTLLNRAVPARWLLLTAILGGLFVVPGAAQAQNIRPAEEEPAALPPLVVINFAGADRLLSDVDYMFKTIGREDLSDVVKGFLSNAGDLKGLDRKKSMGVMLYLKLGFPPVPEPVGFVPVNNISDLLKTIQLGPVKTRKVAGEENRYEIEGPRQTLQVKLQGGYAYVSNNAEAFDRELPDPGPLTQSLTNRYDIAASVNIEGVPETMRTIFLDFLRAQVEADLQQRDNEPEAGYRARKAAGMNNLKNIEALIKYGKSLTLGIDASEENKTIVVEFEVKAKASSSFAKDLNKFPGKPTIFANVYTETVPMAMTGSWNLAKADKEVFVELIKALEAGVNEGLQNQNLDPTAVAGIVKSLDSTAKNGAIDFFVQFVGEPPGKFSLVGGLKVDHAGDFAAGLQGLLQQVAKLPNIAEMELNAETHNGVALHRVLGKGNGGRDERNLYGGQPSLYIGAGRGAVWFGLGRDGTADRLKAAMTQLETIPEKPIPADQIAPFQMILNLSSWIALGGDSEPSPFAQAAEEELRAAKTDEERRRAEQRAKVADRFEEQRKVRRQAAKDAFNPDNDLLRVTARPVKDGFRLKLQFDEGFIRFLGIRASSRLDRSQL